jgi:hypothetical protein
VAGTWALASVGIGSVTFASIGFECSALLLSHGSGEMHIRMFLEQIPSSKESVKVNAVLSRWGNWRLMMLVLFVDM